MIKCAICQKKVTDMNDTNYLLCCKEHDLVSLIQQNDFKMPYLAGQLDAIILMIKEDVLNHEGIIKKLEELRAQIKFM